MEASLHDMDDLLAKYIAREADADEQAQVQKWLNASEGNQSYFNQFVSIWQQTQMPDESLQVDTEAVWQKFRSEYMQASVKKLPIYRSSHLFRVAAAVIIAISGSWLAYTFIFEPQPSITAQKVIISGVAVKVDTLPDRSVVTLNKSSELSYPQQMNGPQRKVALKGEAFFEIKADAARPFLIDANQVQIKVLGTSFNVKTSEAATEIIVRSGRVEVSHGVQKMILTTGEKVSLLRGVPVAEVARESGQLYSYYVSKTFVCDNTPLWKLVEKLNEVYDVSIVIERKELAVQPLTVSFNDESLDTILDIISQTLLLKVDKQGSDIFLR